MRGLRTAVLAAGALVLVAGCAAVAGLSELQRDDCAFGCDEGGEEAGDAAARDSARPGADAPAAEASRPDTGAADAADANPVPPECTAGAARCTDGGLETCGDGGTWGSAAPCAGQVCIQGQCTGLCSPGQTQCSGNGVETCGANGQWSQPSSCGSSTCVGGQCTGSCASGQTQCSGDAVESCGNDGQWGSPTPCAGQACANGQCTGVCVPGTTSCNAQSLQTCDATGQWQTTATCPVACCGGACVDTNTDPSNCGGCGQACGTGTCGAGFTAFTGTQPPGWTANGNAIYDTTDAVGQLTDLAGWEAGSWIYDDPILVDAVTIQFDFWINGGTADGMGLVLQTNGVNAVGAGGGGLGMSGLGGFGVEIDEYDNAECLDDSANHVGIDLLATCSDGPPSMQTVNDSPGITVSDGNWHTMVVQIVDGAFTVTADGNAEFSSYTPPGWTNGTYYLGFAGATGGAYNYHRFRNVSVAFTTPHCY